MHKNFECEMHFKPAGGSRQHAIFSAKNVSTSPLVLKSLILKSAQVNVDLLWPSGTTIKEVLTVDNTENEQLTVIWQKHDANLASESIVPFVSTAQQDVQLDANMPSSIECRVPFTVSYTILNTTAKVVKLGASVDLHDNFVMSGYRECKLRLMPQSKQVLRYTFVALNAGPAELPRLHLYKGHEE